MFKLYDDIHEMISNDLNILFYLKERYKIDSNLVFFYSKEEPVIPIRITDKILKLRVNNGYLSIVLLYFTSHTDTMSFVKKNEFKNKILFTDVYDLSVESSIRVIINNLLTNDFFRELCND